MINSKLTKSFAASLLVVVLGAPAIATAATPSYLEERKATVSYADLNLENEAGVRVLYRRLQRAAKDVCGVAHLSNAPIRVYQQARQCYQDTLSEAIADIDNTALTRIHSS